MKCHTISKESKATRNKNINLKLDKWLQSQGVISEEDKPAALNVNQLDEDVKNSLNMPKRKRTKDNKTVLPFESKDHKNKKAITKTQKLNRTIKPQINVLNDSCDLPSFQIGGSTGKRSQLYKKYGVRIPTVREVLQEQKELKEYKKILENIQDMNETNLNISFSPVKSPRKRREKILDCKDLSEEKLLKSIRTNLKYLSDIINEQVFNERHRKYYAKHKTNLTCGINSLKYNSSTIVFTYGQIEFMLIKLRKYLDPEDKLTEYFLQVLLPELCLKIFMATHKMSYEQAVVYLDSRPIFDN